MEKNMKSGVIIILAVVLLVVVMLGMIKLGESESKEANTLNNFLPINAKITKDHGNGWVEFELDNKTFLFHNASSYHQGFRALTQIVDEEKRNE